MTKISRRRFAFNIKQLVLIVFCVIAGTIIVLKRDTIIQMLPKAANSCNYLTVQLSTDGKTPQQSISIPANQPTKYYLHVKSNGGGCETNFDATSRICKLDGSNCVTRSNTPWSYYRSNSEGIARVDLNKGLDGNNVFYARFRPAGRTDIPWSNEVQVTIESRPVAATTASDQVNLEEYFQMKPGYLWIYSTKNNVAGVEGVSRIQIEEETVTSGCGIVTRPWRFTKDKREAYWNPLISGQSFNYSGNANLRWFIVSPSYVYNTMPQFNKYIWGLGDKSYNVFPATGAINPLRDIPVTIPSRSHLFQTTVGRVPAYNLSLKKLSADFSYMDTADNESYYPPSPDLTSCVLKTNAPSTNSWKIRTTADTISINKGSFVYSGPALRIDYFEGGSGLETGNGLLRESWYFVKNIGLVEIKTKYFNKYGGWSAAPMCKDDSDCLADTMQNPHVDMVLTNYFQNPSFQAVVSADGVNYSAKAETSTTRGYYLKMVDPSNSAKIIPFSGYLEASDRNGKIFKWSWIENGAVFISPKILNGFPSGSYPAKFRIWVPNETFPNERRVSDTPLPWSNMIEVILK